MPARTAACHRQSHRTEWSAWLRVVPPSTVPYTDGGTMSDASPLPAAVDLCRPDPSRSRSGGGPRPGHEPKIRRPLLLHLQRILDRIEGRELDVVELAADLLHLADVDVLDDVARLGIDRDRPARALPRGPLHGRDETVAVRLAAGLLERVVHELHA